MYISTEGEDNITKQHKAVPELVRGEGDKRYVRRKKFTTATRRDETNDEGDRGPRYHSASRPSSSAHENPMNDDLPTRRDMKGSSEIEQNVESSLMNYLNTASISHVHNVGLSDSGGMAPPVKAKFASMKTPRQYDLPEPKNAFCYDFNFTMEDVLNSNERLDRKVSLNSGQIDGGGVHPDDLPNLQSPIPPTTILCQQTQPPGYRGVDAQDLKKPPNQQQPVFLRRKSKVST
jgi:hypothetical protein